MTLFVDLESREGTSSSGVTAQEAPSQTMASITRRFGMLRDRTSLLDSDTGMDHRAAQRVTLDLLARERVRESIQVLLDDLFAKRGLSWSDIAKSVGVSVQAVRKWRQGGPVTGQNRLSIAQLAALLDLLENVPILDPASWLEVPVLRGYKPRHLDLYIGGRADLLFDLAHLRIEPEQALDEFMAEWRSVLRLDHEVFVADDGQLSIRRKF